MERLTVDSSNLESIGYDVESQILEVEFKHRSVYQYFGVPKDVYLKLMNADSHGVFFSANIRNVYKCEKVK